MATKTANYNLVKPIGKEKVDINVLNTNMDAIDTALRELDSSKVNIANNLTTTEEGYALDALQGKVLADRVTEVNRDLSAEITNLNEFVNNAITNIQAEDVILSTANQTLYGVSNVDEALKKSYNGKNNVMVKFTSFIPDTTTPMPNAYTFTINGITFPVSQTNSSVELLLPIGSYNVQVSPNPPFPIDVVGSVTFPFGSVYSEINLFKNVTTTTKKTFTSSTNLSIIGDAVASAFSSVDICIIGAGGGGGGGACTRGGGGGGGSIVTNVRLAASEFFNVNLIRTIIGTGGNGGNGTTNGSSNNGGDGGTSSVTVKSSYSSAGGRGGRASTDSDPTPGSGGIYGGGNGGSGTTGGNGSSGSAVPLIGSSTYGSGGGGGGGGNDSSVKSGGYGGNGAGIGGNGANGGAAATDGSNGSSYGSGGGGGGGGIYQGFLGKKGGGGANGIVVIQFNK